MKKTTNFIENYFIIKEMRPTDLQFRSPKEKTPDPYTCRVTNSGKLLFNYKSPPKSSFGRDKRFRSYDIDAKRLGIYLGP